MNGETETGVTTFFLQHEIDTGNIILQETEPISLTDSVGDLYERLMSKGAELVLRTVVLIESDMVIQKPQKIIGSPKLAPKIFKETCKIDWDKSAETIRNHVRGLNPYPTAWIMINNQICKIFEVEALVDNNNVNKIVDGSIETDNKTYLKVKTEDGWVSIKSLQMQGKKRMPIEDFLRGNKIETNITL